MTEKHKQKNSQDKNAQDCEGFAQLLGEIYETGYVSRKRLYRMSFIKGVLAGFGGVIGATIVVTLLLWILSLFNYVPFVRPITENVRETIQSKNSK